MAKQDQKTQNKPDKKKKAAENENSKTSKIFTGERIKWTILIVGIIIAIAGTVLLAKYILWPQYKKYKDQNKMAQKVEEKENGKEMGPIFTIGDLTVNPYGSNGLRFVIAEIALEAESEDSIEELKKREPQIKDLLIRYFRQRSTNQILDPAFQDSSTKNLREEINSRLYKGKIDSLYYLKLVVQ
jgi:flagellar FliL protein